MTLFAWVYVACRTSIIEYGRRRLLAVVDDRVGPEVADDRLDEGVVGQVADGQLDLELR